MGHRLVDMDKPRRKPESCFYCDRGLSQRRERDHAPIPKSAGGTDVVASCPACHHMKDRVTLDSWMPSAFIAGCRSLAESGALDEDTKTWPENWDSLSTEARIIWAKFAREANRGSELPAFR